MTTTILEPQLLTAEEYSRLPDDGKLTELVRGKFVEMNRPFTSHGYYVIGVASLLRHFVQQHGLGRIVGGDAGIVGDTVLSKNAPKDSDREFSVDRHSRLMRVGRWVQNWIIVRARYPGEPGWLRQTTGNLYSPNNESGGLLRPGSPRLLYSVFRGSNSFRD